MSQINKEIRLGRINAQFTRATPRRYRRRWQPPIPLVLAAITFFGLTGAAVTLPHTHLNDAAMADMSAFVRVRHLAASPNCSAARLVGVAPARRGEPGYWSEHDADRDGIACERGGRN